MTSRLHSQVSRGSPLWAITSYFTFDDPPGEARRLAAYRVFRERLEPPLVTVELSLDGRFHLTPDDAEILIQIQGGSLLWQKERLLNLALAALPPECETVAWLDGDVVLERPDWTTAAEKALDDYALLQPFRRQIFLQPGELPESCVEPAQEQARECISALWRRGELAPETFRGAGWSQRLRYTPGMAWVARRSLLERHGFYDALILGSADKAMFSAACGRQDDAVRALEMSPAQAAHFLAWAEPFARELAGEIGYLEGDVYHLWHGELRLRQYGSRYQDFAAQGFDPARDLRQTAEGAWELACEKPLLEGAIRRFFERRQGETSIYASSKDRSQCFAAGGVA